MATELVGETSRYAAQPELIDQNGVPISIVINSGKEIRIEPHFTPSPRPRPCDLRRLTGLDFEVPNATSTIGIHLTMAYQSVGLFNIPGRLLTKLIKGGLTEAATSTDFTACSVR
jgi:hypothetical protein